MEDYERVQTWRVLYQLNQEIDRALVLGLGFGFCVGTMFGLILSLIF